MTLDLAVHDLTKEYPDREPKNHLQRKRIPDAWVAEADIRVTSEHIGSMVEAIPAITNR